MSVLDIVFLGVQKTGLPYQQLSKVYDLTSACSVFPAVPLEMLNKPTGITEFSFESYNSGSPAHSFHDV
jgi:hypothetical protein